MNLDRGSAGGIRAVYLLTMLVAVSGAFVGGRGFGTPTTGTNPSTVLPMVPDTKTGDKTSDRPERSSHIWNDPLASDLWQLEEGKSWPSLLGKKKSSETSLVRVLYCLVPGLPYPEDVDERRRTRIAVHGALNQLRYRPENASALKSIRIDSQSVKLGTIPELPFERFKRDASAGVNDWVVCLYVDEDKLGDTPVRSLASAHEAIRGGLGVDCDRLDPQLLVLGPSKSSRMKAFLRESGSLDWDGESCVRNCRVFMTGASVSIKHVAADLPEQSKEELSRQPDQRFTFDVGHVSVCMERAPTDLALCHTLADELALRNVWQTTQKDTSSHGISDCLMCTFKLPCMVGPWLSSWFPERLENVLNVCPTIPATRIVLLAEEGTLYGRTIEEDCRQALLSKDKNSTIETYWFPRGLDGNTPLPQPESMTHGPLTGDLAVTGISALGDALNPRQTAGQSSKAFGDPTIDYLERLRMQLCTLDGKAPIAAIGILCNDVNDKLIILKTLRKAFSNCWFFTTDLDAQFLHDSNLNATHNLIVATPLGILDPRGSKDIVDFLRDSYRLGCLSPRSLLDFFRRGLADDSSAQMPLRSQTQMAAYVGTQRLISADSSPPPTQPEAYELGLSGPVRMDATHPDPRRTGPIGHSTWVTLLGLLIIYLIALPIPSNPFHHLLVRLYGIVVGGNHTPPAGPTVQLVLASLFGCWLVVHTLHTAVTLSIRPQEEPFFWNAGVSVWPTEIFRSLIAAAALICYAWVIFRQYEQAQAIEELFPDLKGATSGTPNGPLTLLRGVCAIAHNVWALRWHLPNNRGKMADAHGEPDRRRWPVFTPDVLLVLSCIFSTNALLTKTARQDVEVARDCWKRFRMANGVGYTLLRCATLSYFLTWGELRIIIPSLQNRHTPIRGHETLAYDNVLTHLLASSGFLLVSLIIDRAATTASVVRRLRDNKTHWQDTIEKHYGPKYYGVIQNKLIDLRLVGALTDTVIRYTNFPYVTIVAIMISRIVYFDNWNWSTAVLQFFLVQFVLILMSEHSLASACNKLRIEKIEEAETRLAAAGDADRASLTEIVKQMRSLQVGGFRAFSESPIAKAILVPLGGAGAVGALQYLSTMHW